ncbi:MAG: DUF4129 domain-containing protein [Mobilicoccus sp.]|nr:DUF4129 domain-containing protein [Mobilicoccus sp.]
MIVASTAPPGTDEARRLLIDELWRPNYLPSWWTIFQNWLADQLAVEVGDTDLTPVFVVLGVLLALALAIVVWRAVARRRRTEDDATSSVVFDGEVLDADAFRERAAAHRAGGRYDEAVIDSYRALTADALARRLVRDLPDLTAHEVGATLAGRFAGHEDDILGSGVLFDRIRYGGRHADATDADAVAALDEALSAATPSDTVTGRTAPAVPR